MGIFDNFVYKDGEIVDNNWVKWFYWGVPDEEGKEREENRKRLEGLRHCSLCTVLSGCYFVKSRLPKRKQRATAESPFGPFEGSETVLSASDIADGPGHNSGFSFNGKTYIAYHRRIIGDTDKNHRMVCIDEMQIEGDTVKPIVMT